jgi:hypothetical protein
MKLKLLTAVAALVACSGAWAQDWIYTDFFEAGYCATAYLHSGVAEDGSDKVSAEAERQALMSSTKEGVWKWANLYRDGEAAASFMLRYAKSDAEVERQAMQIIIKDDCAKWISES